MRRCSAGTCRPSASTGRCCATMCSPRCPGSRTPISNTLTNHGVTIFSERATLTGPNSIRLEGGKEVTAGKILIATGARPVMPKIDGIEHAISSNEVFHLEKLPKRIVIAGGGYIANEFAGIFHEFGTQVTLVNRSDVILRHYDQQLVDRLIQISLRKGHRLQVQRDDRQGRAARGRPASHRHDGLRRHRRRSALVRHRTPAERRGTGAGGCRSQDLATKGRSRSTRTIAPRCPRSSRSATSPTASS